MKYYVFCSSDFEKTDVESYDLSFNEVTDAIRDFFLDPKFYCLTIKKYIDRRNEKYD